MSVTRMFIRLNRLKRGSRLAKSQPAGSAVRPRLEINPTRAKETQPPIKPTTARPGGYVRVQRPDMHAAPILARCISVGKDGIMIHDDRGTRVKVRHAHVLEAHATPTGQERAGFARALAAQGVPVGLEEQFLQLDAAGRPRRRPTASQLQLLEALTQHGTPIDLEGVRAGATYEDALALLRRYVTDPAGRVTT